MTICFPCCERYSTRVVPDGTVYILSCPGCEQEWHITAKREDGRIVTRATLPQD